MSLDPSVRYSKELRINLNTYNITLLDPVVVDGIPIGRCQCQNTRPEHFL